MRPKHNLNDDLTQRPGQKSDNEFIYLVKKATLRGYVEQTWGPWDEKFQVARHNEIVRPEEYQIIEYHGKDIGVQKIQEDSQSVEIDIIEILPEYQNKGIGTHLLKNFISSATRKHKFVSLQVLKVNTRALKLYQLLRFHVIQETDTHLRMQL
jgi:ribosomal protein S18 acetylase RimI-like enzyme